MLPITTAQTKSITELGHMSPGDYWFTSGDNH